MIGGNVVAGPHAGHRAARSRFDACASSAAEELFAPRVAAGNLAMSPQSQVTAREKYVRFAVSAPNATGQAVRAF